MRAYLTLLAIAVASVAAVPACTPNAECLGGATTCKVYQSRPQSLVCGTCEVRDGCARCRANADQTGCSAEPVACSKTAIPSSGFGITAPCGPAAVDYAGAALVEPDVFTADATGTLAITLTVKLATLDAQVFSFRSRQYCYTWQGAEKCTVPGPTLQLRPGDTLVVTLVNALPAEIAQASQWVENQLRHPNIVNFHTHGLHVSPRQDNVMPHLAPGAQRVYTIDVPADHSPGTHWYHSHMHGASTLQLHGGMAGAIVVKHVNGTMSSGIATFDAMATRLLVLTHHPVCSCNPTEDPFAARTIPHLMNLMGDTTALNFAQAAGRSETDVYLTNGKFMPVMSARAGEWVRLELLNAVADQFLEIEARTAVNGGGSVAGNMHILGYDGVMLSAPRAANVAVLTIAGRVSLALKFDAVGTYYVQSFPANRAADYESVFSQTLLKITVAGSTTMATPAWTAADVTRPYYLLDLTGLASTDARFETGVDQTGAAATGAGAWLGVGADCALQCGGRGGNCTVSDLNTYGRCAYMPFNATGIYRFAAPVCSTVEWTIHGRGATAHPLHLHAHHFQVISFPASGTQATPWGQAGDWRDTWPAISGRSVVRFRANAYTGALMIHCHYLMHEDLGMMDRIWIGDRTSRACTATSLAANCNSAVPLEAFGMEFAAAAPVDCTLPAPPPASAAHVRFALAATLTVILCIL